MEKQHPTIGIAFGGGGIRGFAHLAIMEKFKEYHIQADMVSGTSIGSGIAAMYAAGRYGAEISQKVFDVDMKKLFSLGGKNGFVRGSKYARTFIELIGVETFEELPIPVRIVSTDLINWRPFIHQSGDLAIAIQASSALPAAFTPVEYGDLLLSDGGAVNNCPADVLRDMGADIVIAIDLDYRSYTRPKNMLEIAQRFMDITVSNGRRAEGADIVIKPFETYVAALALTKAELCYQQGETAIQQKMPEILALLRQWYADRALPYPDYLREDFVPDTTPAIPNES